VEKQSDTKNRGWYKLAIIAVLIVGIYCVFRFTPLSLSDLTPERVKSFILGFGVTAPIAFVVIYTLRAVILVLPVGVMSLAGGLAFGKWWGTVYILIGATAGSCLSFLMARYLGRQFIERMGVLKKGRLKISDESVEQNGLRMILFLRLIPLFQYDAVNFGSGLSRMRFRDFALGSFIGMVPGGFINALLGSSLENIISVQFFSALGVFVLLMFVPTIYKLIKHRREGKSVSHRPETKTIRGTCPDCGSTIGPGSVLTGWDKWGRFVCPGCGHQIRFKGWILAVCLLVAGMVVVERILHFFLISDASLLLSFGLAVVLAVVVMWIVPRFWKFDG